MLNEALRLIRVFHDKTAKELAGELGISVAKLSKIETGKLSPTIDLLAKYATVFGTTTSALLMFADNLDNELHRGRFKVKIRNVLFSLLKSFEGIVDGETDKN